MLGDRAVGIDNDDARPLLAIFLQQLRGSERDRLAVRRHGEVERLKFVKQKAEVSLTGLGFCGGYAKYFVRSSEVLLLDQGLPQPQPQDRARYTPATRKRRRRVLPLDLMRRALALTSFKYGSGGRNPGWSKGSPRDTNEKLTESFVFPTV